MTTKASTSAFHRQDVKFASAKDYCAAWIYQPTSSPLSSASSSTTFNKYPAVILGHGLGAIKEMGLDRYASRFAELGIICLAFDYRHFGESGGQPRQLLDIKLQLQDWDAALDYVSKLENVDSNRIGIFGSSFGGGHVITVAARDKRVKAVISQCPFTSGLHSSRTVGLLPLLKLGVLGIRDLLFSKRNSIIPVQLTGSPGDTALMNAPDVIKYRKLVPSHLQTTYKDYVAARFALFISLYNPGWKTASVHCPIFFAICAKDSVAPPRPTLAYAAKAPKATIKHYQQMGHFDIYMGDDFEVATKDYCDFLRSNL
ncbi:related to hydrolases of the alpha/beta superfamily [Ustilago trichophora]|uniref:Related to hydrolases of the alpha/beta superfamily n=1 Tax=Ustilago trichophora TaxID=86804 RepID=A0A5C3EDI4_9BASI|nr:related to hydrolases of the alpha/beta superfamily [Ustilago trichophora]